MIGHAAFAGAIGLAACLLFQIQFLLAREILPWFGGAPAVWSTSLVVFQSLLLAGYGWAHAIAHMSRRRQVVIRPLATCRPTRRMLLSSDPECIAAIRHSSDQAIGRHGQKVEPLAAFRW